MELNHNIIRWIDYISSIYLFYQYEKKSDKVEPVHSYNTHKTGHISAILRPILLKFGPFEPLSDALYEG
jgi:hypothetical protein